MEDRIITPARIAAFGRHLQQEERARGTVEKYLRDVRALAAFAAGAPVTKELVAGWKQQLTAQAYAPRTVNSMLAAVHGFFAFQGWPGCQVRYLKVQRRLFRDPDRDMTREDYEKLVRTAEGRGDRRLALLLETICATGIRVSELRYITLEAARQGRAQVALKGKIRTVLIPGKLAKKLLRYAKSQKIAAGELFRTGRGKSMSRRQIWGQMKALCRHAGVEPRRVFPHNLRHLFAKAFYRVSRDIVRLADVLGHSSIETTRIYLLGTGAEHTRQLERLGLVI